MLYGYHQLINIRRFIMPGTKYCINCGAQIDEEAESCPRCGFIQYYPDEDQEEERYYQEKEKRHYQVKYQHKSPFLAVILSFFVVGLGQVYNGQILKGIIIFVAAIIAVFLWAIIIGILFSILIWLYAIYDAYTTAQRINDGELVEDLDFGL